MIWVWQRRLKKGRSWWPKLVAGRRPVVERDSIIFRRKMSDLWRFYGKLSLTFLCTEAVLLLLFYRQKLLLILAWTPYSRAHVHRCTDDLLCTYKIFPSPDVQPFRAKPKPWISFSLTTSIHCDTEINKQLFNYKTDSDCRRIFPPFLFFLPNLPFHGNHPLLSVSIYH